MRSISTLLFALSFLFSVSVAFAQNGLPQIPEDAFFVSRISGASIQSKMSIAEMEGLPVFKSMFEKGLTKAQMSSLADSGIDYSADAYVFAQKNDSITNLCWMLPLADLEKFKSTILLEMGMDAAIEPPYTKNELTIYWNEGAAVFVTGWVNDSYVSMNVDRIKETYEFDVEEYEWEDSYGLEEAVPMPEYDIEEETDRSEAYREELNEEIEAIEDTYEEIEVIEDDYGNWEIVEEEVVEDEYSSGYEDAEAYEEYDPYAYDYGYNDLSWSEKKQLAQVWQSQWTNDLIETVGSPVLLSTASHMQVAASSADACAYFDYSTYMDLMMSEVMGQGMMPMGGMYSSLFNNMAGLTEGASLFSEIEFEEEEIVWDMVYTTRGKAAEMQANMLDAKLSKAYLKYMNSSDMIGFYTTAINTEATLDYYAEIVSSYLGGVSMNELAGEVSADLISLVIDEEAIAELFPGSLVITFSDLSKRMIEYTTYDYDENWNPTEITREKEEILPTFLAMMQTERSELVTKMLKLASMQEEVVETDFGFQVNGGPFPVYLMVKGGMLFVGNDLNQLNDIRQGRFKAGLSSDHKKAITKNNLAFFFDANELIEDMELEFPNGEMADMIGFAKGKADRMMITSALLDENRSFMKAVIDVPEGEANGWSYMMHMFNSFFEMEQGY